MKKNYFVTALFALFVFTTSCETEPVDPYLSGINNPVLNPSSSDYFPRELNNVWKYKTNGILDSTEISIANSSVIGSGAWYNLSGDLFLPKNHSASSFVRKVEGDYYIRLENLTSPTTIQTPYEVIILKENAQTGETWNQEITNTISYTEQNIADVPQRIKIENTIVAKDVAMTINGVRYNSVVNVSSRFSDGSNNTYKYTINTWFEKGVGVVRQVLTNEDDYTVTKVLQDYTIN
jgi:hypothetical protein